MITLLALMFVAAAGVAYLARNVIPPRMAAWIGAASIAGLLTSGGALGLLLASRLPVSHSWIWGWSLIALFLTSLYAAPFGVLPLLLGQSAKQPGLPD